MGLEMTDELRLFVRTKVESGQYPSEDAVLLEALRRFQRDDRASGSTEPWIDAEAIAYYEAEADETLSIEQVREATAGIRGSMTEVVIEEVRAERL